MRGWYAVLIDDVSPIRSGIGSYRTREQAMQPCTNHCCLADAAALQWGMPRPQKITFGEMRSSGVRGLLIYCSDYRCSHSIAISADPWPGQVRLSDLEPLCVPKT
jgi:hypothetical protein